MQVRTQKITPFLWFDGKAEEAVNFYTSVFKNSNVKQFRKYENAGPNRDQTIVSASFELNGVEFMALDGGPMFTFSQAISFFVHCETQEEIDHLWTKLSADGEEQMCGWLKDKYGVSWQIIPDVLDELLNSKDSTKAVRAMEAMMSMQKLDIAALQAAYNGTTAKPQAVTIEAIVNRTAAEVWEFWNAPEHITKWCYASPEWHAPFSENDLRVGGKITTTMAAKDGSMSFDFWGIYDKVEPHTAIEYTLGDGRKVEILFKQTDNGIHIIETFEAENSNPVELQRTGWQAILDNFKRYAEGV